jgi:hypothetical protein
MLRWIVWWLPVTLIASACGLDRDGTANVIIIQVADASADASTSQQDENTTDIELDLRARPSDSVTGAIHQAGSGNQPTDEAHANLQENLAPESDSPPDDELTGQGEL